METDSNGVASSVNSSNKLNEFLKVNISKNANQINAELLSEVLIVILGLNTVQTFFDPFFIKLHENRDKYILFREARRTKASKDFNKDLTYTPKICIASKNMSLNNSFINEKVQNRLLKYKEV
jgi:hypothetical protein